MRRNERKTLKVPRSGLTYQLLTPDLNRQIEFILIELEPGQGGTRVPLGHPGEEAAIVLEGQLDVWIGDEEHVLDGRRLDLLQLRRPAPRRQPRRREGGPRLGDHAAAFLIGGADGEVLRSVPPQARRHALRNTRSGSAAHNVPGRTDALRTISSYRVWRVSGVMEGEPTFEYLEEMELARPRERSSRRSRRCRRWRAMLEAWYARVADQVIVFAEEVEVEPT